MIVPMKKYTLLIHHKDYRKFLRELQDLGMLDVVDKGIEPDDDTNCEIQRISQFDRAIKILESQLEEGTAEKTDLMPGSILKKVLQMDAESETLQQKITSLNKVYRSLYPWGDFSVELIQKLEKKGIFLSFYSMSEKKFRPEWQDQYNLEVISHGGGKTNFVIVRREDEVIDIDAEEVKAPERSAPGVLEEKKQLEARIEEINIFYRENAAAFLPVLKKARADTENRVSFDNVMRSTDKQAEDRLMVLEGWVPNPKQEKVDAFLDKHSIFFLTSMPEKDDNVPVLLTNNRYSRLFEPIGNLYSLPKYGELDLTPFFAPFFMLFFGFCLGDAGYGLLILIGATIFKRRKSKEMKRILTLLQWLGVTTIILGELFGTFFGINLIEVAEAGTISWLVPFRELMFNSEKMFYFALVLGGVQIIYGMCIRAVNITRQRGFKYALSTIGWITLIIGSVALYALQNEHNTNLITILFYILLGVSGILIMLLNNPSKNLLINFGGGLWDVYSMATGVMGDLLSYIRLFALGVSSSILGYVFNDLALQMSGDIPVLSQLIFVIILLVGHGLNIFMASLGAFVHPMRLTFVEFYKNAGFKGGGKSYDPFRRKEMETKSKFI
jgi:V/A-type H+-transporting ATPase subunit I